MLLMVRMKVRAAGRGGTPKKRTAGRECVQKGGHPTSK